MARINGTSIPLGTPGQIDGRATTQSDRGDETQSVFRYQWTAAVLLLAVGIDNAEAMYIAVWCEHHDDLLAETRGGLYHAIQVKTQSGVNARWICSDKGFSGAVGKFCEHERSYSEKLEKYIFYSNAPPYIPAPTATKPHTLAKSPMRLVQECKQVDSYSTIAEPYRASFDSLVADIGSSAELVFAVLQKLDFMQGLTLQNFEEQLAMALGRITHFQQMPVARLWTARDALMQMVGAASSLSVPSIAVCTSILQSDGRPEVAIRAKCVSLEAVESAIRQSVESGFRYANSEGQLQLGQAKGQKEVLKRKMSAGYVGNFFPAIWQQAMAAERRLMESATLSPTKTKKKVEQLEAVVLVACQNAEAKHMLESDERVRGIKIYQEILESTNHLATNDRETVEYERAETLRGVAGLLSGSCQFAWGAPWNDSETENGT